MDETGASASPPHDGPAEPDVKPLDVDGVGAMVVGSVLWGVALVLMLVLRSDLQANDNEWWIWTCVSGFVLGLVGIAYTRWRRDAISRVRARQGAAG